MARRQAADLRFANRAGRSGRAVASSAWRIRSAPATADQPQPRVADGQLYGPDAPPMALALFVDRYAEWVIDYNTVHRHSALGGLTPLARWTADPTQVREVPEEQLRWLLQADVERTINRDGVHFGGETFIAPELNGRVGERVQVRYTPHDLRRIEVFRGDTWLCTAHPQGQLFRTAARRLLDPAGFARVDAVYRPTLLAARDLARRWTRPGTELASIDPHQAAAALQRHTIDATSLDEVLT